MATKKSVRKRDSAASRSTILRVARERFTAEGYGGLSLRQIAIEAGYDVALVARYFGSKEALFREVLIEAFRLEPMLTTDRANFGVKAVEALYSEPPRKEVLDHFMLVIRALTVPREMKSIRTLLHTHFLLPLARWLGGENAHARASLLSLYLTGAALQSDWAGPLSSAESKKFRHWLATRLQALVDGDEIDVLKEAGRGRGANAGKRASGVRTRSRSRNAVA